MGPNPAIRSWSSLGVLLVQFLLLFTSKNILLVDCFSQTNKMQEMRSIDERLSPLVFEMKEEWQQNACEILQNAVAKKEKGDLISLVNEYLSEMMQQLAPSGRRNKKSEYRDLQRHAKKLLTSTNTDENMDATVFTIGLLLGALSLFPSELNASSKAIASAIVAMMSSNSIPTDERISMTMVQIFLQHYIHNSKHVNLSILVYLVQAMNIKIVTTQLSTLSAKTIVVATSTTSNEKDDWMAALKLACFIPPCPKMISLKECIHLAIAPYKLWHVAEKLCHQYPEREHTSIQEAVEFLIHSAWQQEQYRMADQISTALHKESGRASIELLAKARYYHARSTIFNMIQKRQYPLIERQVDRVDHISAKNQGKDTHSQDIRTYTLEQLKQVGEIESFIRYATLWQQPIPYTEEEYQQMHKDAQEKKQTTYLQWTELFDQEPLPQLISNVSDLLKLKDFFSPNASSYEHYGFDAEWDDDCRRGVAILQIATITQVLLLDMIALTSTKEGMDALQQTVGNLFSTLDNNVTIIGFSCRQDLQKLRQHLTTIPSNSDNILDLKVLVSKEEPSLKELGLSKVCHHYLGKPLDKSEQCSNWSSNRPLSISQRVYAALDAYVCVAIYQKLQQPSLPNKKHKK